MSFLSSSSCAGRISPWLARFVCAIMQRSLTRRGTHSKTHTHMGCIFHVTWPLFPPSAEKGQNGNWVANRVSRRFGCRRSFDILTVSWWIECVRIFLVSVWSRGSLSRSTHALGLGFTDGDFSNGVFGKSIRLIISIRSTTRKRGSYSTTSWIREHSHSYSITTSAISWMTAQTYHLQEHCFDQNNTDIRVGGGGYVAEARSRVRLSIVQHLMSFPEHAPDYHSCRHVVDGGKLTLLTHRHR